MKRGLLVLAAGTAVWSAMAFAQSQAPWPAPAQQPVQDRWPQDPLPDGAPKQSPRPAARSAATTPDAPAPAARPQASAQPPRAVACAGAFAKDSNHLKLATLYGAQNVTFTDVSGPEGAKLKASVIFPKDPKRRLEVLWQNEASRSDTALVAINGQSTWTAPKGLRLGLGLPALEKLNGKPFKLTGFDADNTASVEDWQDGALASLPGGCKVGIRFAFEAKASEQARGAVAGASKEYMSSDPLMRAASPKIAEILIGY